MKICFITTGDIKDIATSKRALGMANPLNELGWEVHILLEDAPSNRLRVRLECSYYIHIHYFPKSGAIAEVLEKNTLIRKIKPDFVYICAFVFRNVVLVGRYTKKIVEHSELQSGIPDIKGVRKIFAHFLEYFSIFYADGLLTASRYLEKLYIEKSKFVFQKVPIIYFPYAFPQNLCKPKSLAELPDKISKLSDKKNIVFLGNITRNYGAFTLLEAFHKLSFKHSHIRLILLGKGTHYKEANAYVKDHNLEDSIFMPGFIEEEDIANYFSIASAFISPMNDTVQDWARCPSKLYMYLPYKKPIITCKIGEPFQVLKETGYYYEPGSVTDLASLIPVVISNQNYEAINPELHTWEQRTTEFDSWIKNYFLNRVGKL